ncbi:Abi family protein [Slackia exigua]|uniref:Abi family protein n=1 Tax=Slackia exigua TaxID=84109 RepID=UPI0028E672A1|nr:Abi family protein [Slackia exigua]
MQHAKKKLTVNEQIAHLKDKGITFELCNEFDAKAYLRTKNNYFRLSAFRKLFQKYDGGLKDGQYIDLDFEQLRNLSYLDQELRSIFLSMTLDVEHYEKVRLLEVISNNLDEDGYSIVIEYRQSLCKNRLESLDREFLFRANDTYCGNIIKKYQDDMPVWAFIEVISFGRFIDFCRFCSGRWNDEVLRNEHYMLKKAKSLRNAAAHGTCIINGFAEKEDTGISLPYQVLRSISDMGITKSLRRKRFENARMIEIATLLYLYQGVVSDGESKRRTIRSFKEFFSRFNASNLYAENSLVFSSIHFIERLTAGYCLS